MRWCSGRIRALSVARENPARAKVLEYMTPSKGRGKGFPPFAMEHSESLSSTCPAVFKAEL
jgi:hypothetical protein